MGVPKKKDEEVMEGDSISGLLEALQGIDAAFGKFERVSEGVVGKSGSPEIKELRTRARSGAHQLVQYLGRLEKKPNPGLANFVQVRIQQMLAFEIALAGLMAEQIEAARFRATATGKLDAHEMVALPRWTYDLAEQIRQTLARHGRRMQTGEVLAASLRFVSLHLRAFEATPLVLGRPDAVYGSLDALGEAGTDGDAEAGEVPSSGVQRSRVLKDPEAKRGQGKAAGRAGKRAASSATREAEKAKKKR